MAPVQRFVRLLNVFGPDQQFRPADPRVHPARIVGSDHGRNASFIQKAFGDLSVRR
jgi:hypothetical protein